MYTDYNTLLHTKEVVFYICPVYGTYFYTKMKIIFTIWSRREYLHWSIRELSEKSGVSRTTVNEIENNLQMPRFDTMVYLSRAMNCDINDLFKIDDDTN